MFESVFLLQIYSIQTKKTSLDFKVSNIKKKICWVNFFCTGIKAKEQTSHSPNSHSATTALMSLKDKIILVWLGMTLSIRAKSYFVL